jgi:hypothetical protein
MHYANASVENAAAKAVLLDQMLRPAQGKNCRTAESGYSIDHFSQNGSFKKQETSSCNSRWIWKPPLAEAKLAGSS